MVFPIELHSNSSILKLMLKECRQNMFKFIFSQVLCQKNMLIETANTPAPLPKLPFRNSPQTWPFCSFAFNNNKSARVKKQH